MRRVDPGRSLICPHGISTRSHKKPLVCLEREDTPFMAINRLAKCRRSKGLFFVDIFGPWVDIAMENDD
jgi:hypothetical protein